MIRTLTNPVLVVLLPAALLACASAPASDRPDAAGAATRGTRASLGSAATRPVYATAPADLGKRVHAQRGAVTSANALASEAGLAMLRAGGNAIDAAVATAFAIGVVEPQMSGLGGSGAMLIWQQAAARTEYLDFYAMQNADSFDGRTDDEPAPVDMRIVGIPGSVAGLLEAHERHGSLPLAQVMAPAIRLAEEGFPVGQVLAQFIRSDSAKLHRFAESHGRMWPDGTPLPPGTLLRNIELAATLRRVAAHGRAGFYEGDVARAVVAALNAGGHPASADDLASFTPQWKRPLCAEYRGHVVLSAPPPQTGAQVIQALKLLEPQRLADHGLPTRSPQAFDGLVSALRVAMADNHGNDDPRWVGVPARGRISDAFARHRQALVGTGTAAAAIAPAEPQPFDADADPAACAPLSPWPGTATPQAARERGPAQLPAHDETDRGETTHVSVVDSAGNAVAVTLTNSTTFGVGAWVAGFFLNDSGFRFTESNIAAPSASRWRTRTSTIAPTIVLEDGQVKVVTGAPGAGRIPTEIVQTLVYVIDYGMDPLDALKMPRIFPAAANPAVQLEHGFTPALLQAIREMGYEPAAQSSSYARLYMIVRGNDGWIAVADPRHDGEPRGY
jgi:gamma-glutamyltranspeptidase / glutathione hydrolase